MRKPWPINGVKIPQDKGPNIGDGPMNGGDCISYYDGPLIWTEVDQHGRTFLIYFIDCFGSRHRYAAFLISPSVVDRMKTGEITIMEGIRTSPFLYVLDDPHGDNPKELTLCFLSSIPRECLPNDGVKFVD